MASNHAASRRTAASSGGIASSAPRTLVRRPSQSRTRLAGAPREGVATRRRPGAVGSTPQQALGKTTTFNAVALQDHVIRSLNLDLSLGGGGGGGGGSGSSRGGSGARLRRRAVNSADRFPQKIERERRRLRAQAGALAARRRKGGAATAPVDDAPDLDFSNEDWICTKCTLLNAGVVDSCVACGSARPDVGVDSRPVTLAQMRGLVKGHEPKLSRKDWEGIAKKVGERKDHEGDCAICMEEFGMGEQVRGGGSLEVCTRRAQC